ncbi:glutathione S-transferase family protein [Brumicola blandensis]|uniref:Glutathione S-transferase n=1 Tax=Brumicola blandensis TaxID=3075611 RepID=A0AAW8QYN8_9ALTE|nr:glutathione S-transferase [Alteromonas sp. W409]MDT0582121.1 glutathione S-transferase [Alteromonas sp. W409]
MTSGYKLYGAPLSLYTGKARSYLTFKNIPFEEVFSSRKVYKNIIEPKTGVRFIPVLETPEHDFVQDTAVMIDLLETRFPERSIIPDTPKQKLVSAILEMWGDEWLLLPAMHYRWNHDNFPFIYEEFGKIAFPRMPAFIRRIAGKKIGSMFKGFVPMLGITPKSIPAIEQWYEQEVLPSLDAHFALHDYLLGARPCVGDFGLMGPLYAHLYRDPASGRIMQKIAPNLVKWVERMNQENLPLGEWLADDEVPDTLLAILTRQFKEFWPVQLNSAKETQKWILNNPEQHELPRKIGDHVFSLGDVSESRAIQSFSQWKLQRVLDLYNGFKAEERAQVDSLLLQIGGLEAMQTTIKHRVAKENNKLVSEKGSQRNVK